MMVASNRLAIDGGQPVRRELLRYARQSISNEDVARVVEILSSDWLTTGPAVNEFEAAFARTVGAGHAAAVSSGTAALHAAVAALDIGAGDEVLVPALTFAASANCVVYRGATPVFVDVDPSTLLMDPERVLGLVTEKTRAVIAVDYAGQPCDYSGLRARIGALQIPIVADACHALGASSGDGTVGSIADISTFSFHPAKHITTGEGGMVTTDDHRLAQRIRQFRNHGITTDLHQREKSGSTTYDMVELGFNYRLTDFQCAMGLSQLERLDTIIEHRRDIARHYDAALSTISEIEPVGRRPATDHSYHLYVIRFPETSSGIRDDLARALRAEGIGTAVHYPPVHLHPFYRRHLNLRPGLCPNAERAAGEILSLPMHSAMGRDDADDVIEALVKVSKGILGQ